jgi:hypothetical protein
MKAIARWTWLDDIIARLFIYILTFEGSLSHHQSLEKGQVELKINAIAINKLWFAFCN